MYQGLLIQKWKQSWHIPHSFMIQIVKSQTTPITTKNFVDSIKYRAADLGRIVGTEFAEGLYHRTLPRSRRFKQINLNFFFY